MNKNKGKYIVITRSLADLKGFSKILGEKGFRVFSYPTIRINKNTKFGFLTQLKDCDWIVFTSKNGVKFFLEEFKKLGGNPNTLNKKMIGVVGSKTKDEVLKNGLSVHFIPSNFTTDDLAREIPITSGQKILLPRANIASSALTKKLKARGATVFSIPIYQTEYIGKESKKLENLLLEKRIEYLTFTSPSTIEGFMRVLKKRGVKEAAFECRVLSIGPVTEKRAREVGFKKIITADTYTTAGMIKKLEDIAYN